MLTFRIAGISQKSAGAVKSTGILYRNRCGSKLIIVCVSSVLFTFTVVEEFPFLLQHHIIQRDQFKPASLLLPIYIGQNLMEGLSEYGEIVGAQMNLDKVSIDRGHACSPWASTRASSINNKDDIQCLKS